MKKPTVEGIDKYKKPRPVKIPAEEAIMIYSALEEFSSSMYIDGNNETARKYAALAKKIKDAGKI